MFKKLILAASLTVLSTVSYAGGSMAPSVSIIFVEPPVIIKRIDDLRATQKLRAKEEKYEAKLQSEADKEQRKLWKEEDKRYAKKLAAQRKAASKKRK